MSAPGRQRVQVLRGMDHGIAGICPRGVESPRRGHGPLESEARVNGNNRQAYVDVFRGLLIAHMALDHASLMFNAGRSGEELAAGAAPAFGDMFQFLTRFSGVPVAPGF